MWGIRHKAMAATAVGVLATVAPMVSVGSMPSALGAPGHHTHVDGTPGDDHLIGTDGDVDRIHCGGGFDVVAYRFSVDQHDVIDSNCEGRIA